VSVARKTPPGATRTCPHCRAVILQSTSVCPSCRKHLRFTPVVGGVPSVPTCCPLRVEGAFRHPESEEAWEYAVTVTITNERGDEVTRQVVAVGALQPGEQRRFTAAVELFKPEKTAESEKYVSPHEAVARRVTRSN
jgi:hypothetical protein